MVRRIEKNQHDLCCSSRIAGARMTDRVVKGRDQYLKPMFDARAWYDKLNPDEEAVNADLR